MTELTRGRMTTDELNDAVHSGQIDTVIAAVPDMYGRLVGKRFTGHHFMDSIRGGGMHICDYLLACDMEMDPVPGYQIASWEKGYGDFHAVPDLTTLRRASWLDKTALVLCDLECEHVPVSVAPREMLKRQLLAAKDLGYSVMGGTEIECYVFDESYESANKKRYCELRTAGSYVEDYHLFQGTKEEALIGAIRRGLDESGVPVECSKGEWGPGQQEINLRYSEALEQCDRNALYKHAAREIAWSQGKAVTFMAKWDEKLAGSSMHIHVSLWSEQGTSAFQGDASFGPVRSSDTFRWFLGGWMRRARELSAFFAPNVSSYKRYQAGSFAPTSIAWSHDNRTAGFRVVGEGPSLRIECRIPGADANPYLVYAASIAAGLDGIRHRIEPPDVFEGDIYQAAGLPQVPANLRDAISALEGSDFAREALGDEVIGHYLHFFCTEQRKFDEVVTDWERARFFERV